MKASVMPVIGSKQMKLRFWPVLTVLRGKVMVADGKFHGDLKDGKYLKRRIPDSIRANRAGEQR